jgi:uncharacterized coiled-coil protein SlyX
MSVPSRRRRAGNGAKGVLSAVLAAAAVLAAGAAGAQEKTGSAETPPAQAETSAKKAAPKKKQTAKKPTTAELLKMIADQRALIEEQRRLIADQQARIADQEAKISGQEARIQEQGTEIAAQKDGLAAMQDQLATMKKQLDELEAQVPGLLSRTALEERLKQIEEEAEKVPELPPNVVSAGDFPGSIRIPGTDTAVKFGGRIRTAAVFTLDDLGSDDRFLTNSIPVTDSDVAAGKGPRTTFSANTSRFNFELRTPAGNSQMRAFIEGDFFGTNGNDVETNFRLRHAYAQFHGYLVGQTWSTFSDPAADHQDLDFEGINGENVIRQAQIRYTWTPREKLDMAVAAETPAVSITGGEGVNVVPDLVYRAVWKFKEIGHLQAAAVGRQIRGQSDLQPGTTVSAFAWGATLSGVVPFRYFELTDRFIYQLNIGKGNARYINDLNSLGGQDAVFDPASGDLTPLKAVGWYLDYEHQWKEWKATEKMKLRSSLIWSFVTVHNLDFQLDDAYHKTNRYSFNLVFSPLARIDVGVEYIYGTRQNKNGEKGNSDQVQFVGIFRF